MNKLLIRMALGILVGMGSSHNSMAYHVSLFQIFPAGMLSPVDDISITLRISTPNTPAWLYRDTEVTVDHDEVIILLYPTSGPFTALDLMTVDVPVGRLEVGEYRLLVLLQPSPSASWGDKFLVSSLSVVPRIQLWRNAQGIRLGWQDPRKEFQLEGTDELSDTALWHTIDPDPDYSGLETYVQLSQPQGTRFFRLRKMEAP